MKNVELIEGSAGVGKTYYMQERIKEELRNNKEMRILAISFTNIAVTNLNKRLSEEFNLEETNIQSATLHKIIFDELDKKGVLSEYRIVNQRVMVGMTGTKYYKLNSDRNSLILMCTELLKLGKSFNSFEELKNLLSDVEIMSSLTRSLVNKDIKKEIQQAYNYLHTLTKYKLMLLDDVMILGLMNFKAEYDLIICDEFQDFTPLELQLLMSERITCNDFLFMYDEFQSIYGWRGADLKTNLDCIKNKTNYTYKHLGVNYRNSEQLVNLGNKITDRKDTIRNDIEIPKGVTSAAVLPYTRAMDKLQELINDYHITDNKTVAILTQSNKVCGEVINQLSDKCDPTYIFSVSSGELEEVFEDLQMLLKIRLAKYDSRTKTLWALSKCRDDIRKYRNIFKYNSMIDTNHLDCVLQEEKDFVVFDLETTNLDKQKAEIVQLCAIRLDGKTLTEKSRINLYVKPNNGVGDTYKVHGLTDEFLLDNGVKSFNAIKEFSAISKNAILVAHNASYDIGVLESYLGNEFLSNNVVDTLDVSRYVFPGLDSYKLENLNKSLNLGGDPNHDAQFDVECTVNLLRKIKTQLLDLNNLTGESISELWETNKKLGEELREVYNSSGLSNIYKTKNMKDLYNLLIKDLPEKIKSRLDVVISYMDSKKLTWQEALDFISSGNKKVKLPNNLTVCTVHQSKGLEFDTVIYLYTMCPKGGASEADENRDYVALMRAKENFLLISTEKPREDSTKLIKVLLGEPN